ncbi:hypothetical protein D3C85_1109020 [compost metagenome]
MATDVAGDFAATRREAEEDHVVQVQVFDQLGQIIGVMVHVVAVPWLARPAMAPAIMRDGPEAVVGEVQHLRFPTVGAQGPTVAEHHRLSAAPVLVIKRIAFASRQSSHVDDLQ